MRNDACARPKASLANALLGCKEAYPEVASQPKILLITDALLRRISSILYKTFPATLQRSEYIITILRLLLFSQARKRLSKYIRL